ncbi:MAG: transglycosylase SLT domain-containing protein [Gammaproteobacteria bacterium]|nr:transglycosylase SLT domain-containing protein [Gammaproteobacteria bacterium]
MGGVFSCRLIAGVLVIPILASCASSPPKQADDLCSIFREKDGWYEDARSAADRWGTPVHVQMAIIRHESSYGEDARPPRRYLLGVIPWSRASSAYGYAQAKDETWDWYIAKTGNRGADRDDFDDAVDFVAWYTSQTHKMLGISKWDTYKQYLAYHEGQGGYRKGSYKKKKWLMKYARKVERTSQRYAAQLKTCKKDLEAGQSWWSSLSL